MIQFQFNRKWLVNDSARNQNNAQDVIVEKVLKIILFIIYERQYTTLFKPCKFVHKLTETLCPTNMQIYGNYFKVDSGPDLEWMISNLTINSKPISILLFIFLLWSITISLLQFRLPMINLINLEYLTSLVR